MTGKNRILSEIRKMGLVEKLYILHVPDEIKQGYIIEALQKEDVEAVIKKIENGQMPHLPQNDAAYLLLKSTAMALMMDSQIRESIKQRKQNK